jgi:hypothetical protein
MTKFDNFVLHYRKYYDYSRLENLQTLVWAYKDYKGQDPKDLSEVLDYVSNYEDTKISADSLSNYKLE